MLGEEYLYILRLMYDFAILNERRENLVILITLSPRYLYAKVKVKF